MKGSLDPNINTHINTATPVGSRSVEPSAETHPVGVSADPSYEIVHVFNDHETRFGTYEDWQTGASRLFDLATDRGISSFDVEQSATFEELWFHDGDHEIRLRPIE